MEPEVEKKEKLQSESTVNLSENPNNNISLEDGFLVAKIIRKALELRPYIKEAIVGEKFVNLSHDEQIMQMLTPVTSFFFVDKDKKVPALFFRFVGNDAPILESYFYPIEAVYSFLMKSRAVLKLSTLNPKENEETTFNYALGMTLMLFDNFYQRALITMDYITDEVIMQWEQNMQQAWLRSESERGNEVSTMKSSNLETLLRSYKKDVGNLWKYQGQSQDNYRKMLLADEYESLFKHWNWLLRMSNDETGDWRDYARTAKHSDTPDDLLNKLGNLGRSSIEASKVKISDIALEHAARRVGLIKTTGVSEHARTKRKQGIKVSGYSSPQLFIYLREGRDLNARFKINENFFAEVKNEPNFEQVEQAALIEKRKSLEQKLTFIQENIDKELEQEAQSALKEN